MPATCLCPGCHIFAFRLSVDAINEKVQATAPAISIYPNPTNYQLNIDLGEERAKSIQLFNVLGMEVRSLENASGIVEIQKNKLAQGMYTVVLHFENGTYSSHKILFN